MKKKIIEGIGNNDTNSLINGDSFSLTSSSYSIMDNGSINESLNRQGLKSRLDASRPNGIVGGSLENQDPAENGVVNFEVSRGSKDSHLE